MMGFGMLGMLLFWIALIVLVVFLARGLFYSNRQAGGSHVSLSAREILEQRYARGEITQEQFMQMQKDLQ